MKIAIVGLGLIGGSIALRLKRKKFGAIIGISRTARAHHAIDVASCDLQDVSEADVVILAVPVRTMLKMLPRLRRFVKKSAVVLDVGSTKTEILRAARMKNFVGGHPIAGTEKSGFANADANLFERRPFILIGRRDARIVRLVRALGAIPVWMRDPAQHDRAIAYTIHLPHAVAYALRRLVEDKRCIAALKGPSYASATRVAASDPDMVLDFLMTNRNNLRLAISDFVKTLRAFSKSLLNERSLRRQFFH